MNQKSIERVYKMRVGGVYPLYVEKAERKGRTKEEVDRIFTWLTGYSQADLDRIMESDMNFETFFAEAPAMNPTRAYIKGVVCGVRVEEIEDPVMREVRYLDKLVDELAKGWEMGKIFRTVL